MGVAAAQPAAPGLKMTHDCLGGGALGKVLREPLDGFGKYKYFGLAALVVHICSLRRPVLSIFLFSLFFCFLSLFLSMRRARGRKRGSKNTRRHAPSTTKKRNSVGYSCVSQRLSARGPACPPRESPARLRSYPRTRFKWNATLFQPPPAPLGIHSPQSNLLRFRAN